MQHPIRTHGGILRLFHERLLMTLPLLAHFAISIWSITIHQGSPGTFADLGPATTDGALFPYSKGTKRVSVFNVSDTEAPNLIRKVTGVPKPLPNPNSRLFKIY